MDSKELRRQELLEKKKRKMEARSGVNDSNVEIIPSEPVIPEIAEASVEVEVNTETHVINEPVVSEPIVEEVKPKHGPRATPEKIEYVKPEPPPVKEVVSKKNKKGGDAPVVKKQVVEQPVKMRVPVEVPKTKRDRVLPSGLPAKYEIWMSGKKIYDSVVQSGTGVLLQDDYIVINSKKLSYDSISIISK